MSPSKRACDFRSAENRRQRKNALHRVKSSARSDIAELVYGFLGNAAILQAERTARKFKGERVRMSRIRRSRRRRRRRRRSCESNKGAPQEPADTKTKSGPGSGQESTQTKIPQDIPKSDTGKSDVSNDRETIALSEKSTVDTKNLLKSRSLVQVINNYIKAGLREGKRRAKRYMCKALSFGLDSGYLIPADREGQVLRVSSTLIDFKSDCEKDDVDDRRRRKSMRSGKESFCTQDRRKLRRNGNTWNLSCGRRRSEIAILRKRDKSITDDRQSRLASDKKKSVTRPASSGRKVKCGRTLKKLKNEARGKNDRRSSSRSVSKNNRGNLSLSLNNNVDVPMESMTNSWEKLKTVKDERMSDDDENNAEEMEMNDEI